LVGRARERYGALDQLDAELSWYRGQYNALDALIEALTTPDRWLVYRAELLRDQPPKLDAQAAEDVSAVERVKTALVDRDEALHKAQEDLAGARTLAAEWEAEVASVRAQLQQDRATLERARSWQSQAEERAKEAEGLRTSLADKAAALAMTEEQLRHEQVARQQAEDQLQQEQTALAEAEVALECERLGREEVQCQLQQERAALEGARATLKQHDDEVSRLNGELIQLSISHEDLRQSLEEQEATVLSLRHAAEDTRQALEAEKKQVKGELSFSCLLAGCFVSFWDPLLIFCLLCVAFRPAGRLGELDDPGSGCADGLQLLATGVGGAAGRRPRGLPGGRGGRGASWELDGESHSCSRRACRPVSVF
jgi:chromosome segregation ATPase